MCFTKVREQKWCGSSRVFVFHALRFFTCNCSKDFLIHSSEKRSTLLLTILSLSVFTRRMTLESFVIFSTLSCAEIFASPEKPKNFPSRHTKRLVLSYIMTGLVLRLKSFQTNLQAYTEYGHHTYKQLNAAISRSVKAVTADTTHFCVIPRGEMKHKLGNHGPRGN